MSKGPRGSEATFRDGRDELNLADFPISVLQRQQPVDEDGKKLDTAVFNATRYDGTTHRRQQQRVVLETSSRYGLPTPADENVILALLYVAKHDHDFTDPVVRFAPRQLFQIMGWAPNSRSYDRLREVLRRLKALVIRYENSWWDIEGRGYEAEVATGIIAEYELGRQTSGRKKAGAVPVCWVSWSPHFQKSLANGNLKKLDLDLLFALKLPTSQRLYRFLDKRFYPPHRPPVVEMDLHDFACGHIGLTRVENVAELKRRLAPAIAELEEIGFIAPVPAAQRYQKVQAGIWRVRFSVGSRFRAVEQVASELVVAPEPRQIEARDPPSQANGERDLVAAFYRAWGAGDVPVLSESDRARAAELLERHPTERVISIIPVLVQIVRKKWPECKSFSGAVVKYWLDALRVLELRERRLDQKAQAATRDRVERGVRATLDAERATLESRWLALPEARRQALEADVLSRHPEHRGHRAILKNLCLSEFAAQELASQESDARELLVLEGVGTRS